MIKSSFQVPLIILGSVSLVLIYSTLISAQGFEKWTDEINFNGTQDQEGSHQFREEKVTAYNSHFLLESPQLTPEKNSPQPRLAWVTESTQWNPHNNATLITSSDQSDLINNDSNDPIFENDLISGFEHQQKSLALSQLPTYNPALSRSSNDPLDPITFFSIGLLILGVQIGVLVLYGQPLKCECGYIQLWYENVNGPGNSQHLTDWYTFSHFEHGLVFYLFLNKIAPEAPVETRFLWALGMESSWEILENSPWIIGRYRVTGLAHGYSGDSIINSVADTMAMAVGFIVADYLPLWGSGVLAIINELWVVYNIRDGVILNIIQLIHPSETISTWQTSGKRYIRQSISSHH